MTSLKPVTVLYRRKRQGQTQYKKRLALLLSRQPRLVVRVTNQKIIAQVVEFNSTADKVILGVDSFALRKLGWHYSCKNLPAAYLTGLLLGKKTKSKGYTQAVLDTGARTPLRQGKIYAFLKGIVDAGLQVPYGDKSIFPSPERISGKHIQDFAASLPLEKRGGQFTQYLKSNQPPEKITAEFEQLRKKLL